MTGKLKWLNQRHLEKTQAFYKKHGGKTLVLARFVPIVRTYAPFVAGLGGFTLKRFVAFSLTGGSLWIVTFLNLGYFFGNIPAVKRNFELVIAAILVISIMPMVVEYWRSRRIIET
jgi:membrane-associated protein